MLYSFWIIFLLYLLCSCPVTIKVISFRGFLIVLVSFLLCFRCRFFIFLFPIFSVLSFSMFPPSVVPIRTFLDHFTFSKLEVNPVMGHWGYLVISNCISCFIFAFIDGNLRLLCKIFYHVKCSIYLFTHLLTYY